MKIKQIAIDMETYDNLLKLKSMMRMDIKNIVYRLVRKKLEKMENEGVKNDGSK